MPCARMLVTPAVYETHFSHQHALLPSGLSALSFAIFLFALF
jgi:hypothetical protein